MTLSPPPKPKVPRTPQNPIGGYLWALAWLVVGALGFLGLAAGTHTVAPGEEGERVEGMVLSTPYIPVVLAGVLLVIAVLNQRAWRGYVERTTAAERQEVVDAPLLKSRHTPFVIAGAIVAALWLAAVVTVFVSLAQLTADSALLSLVLMLVATLGLAAIALLHHATRVRAAHARAGVALAP